MQSPESPAERVHEPAGRWYLHLKHAARPHTCDDANFCFGSLERFRAKWIPVRVKKTRQNKNLEPRSDSIGTEKALDGPPLQADPVASGLSARGQNHHDLAALETGVLLDLRDFRDVALDLVQ